MNQFDARIEGTDYLAAFSRHLRQTGEVELKRKLNKALRAAGKPTIQQARQNALGRLPRRGGLASDVARSKMSMRNRLANRHPTLRIEARNEAGIRDIDRGRLRHPVFGNTEKWVTQTVPSGWWSDATKVASPIVRKSISAALDEIQRELSQNAGRATHEFGSRGEFR